MSDDRPAAEEHRVRFRLLWRVVRPFRGKAGFVIALVVLNTALASLGIGMVFPILQALLDPTYKSATLSKLIPLLERLSPDERLLALAGATVLLFAVKETVSVAATYFTHDLLQRLRFYWVERIGERYLLGRYLWLAGQKQGKLLNDWFGETLVASRFFQSYFLYLSSAVLVVALSVLGLLVNWQLMLTMLAGGAIVALAAGRLLYASSARMSSEKLGVNQAVSGAMVENLANVRDIKLMLAERRRLDDLDVLTRRLKRIFVRGAVMGEFPRNLGEFLAVTVLMSIVVGGLLWLRVSAQEMLPLLVFFFVAFYRLVTSASQAMSSRVKALIDVHSVYLMDRLMNDTVATEDRASGAPIERIETDLRFRGLGFSFEAGKRALHAVSATIPKGKSTLLVGPSGAGKSTLLDLLLRLEEPSEGSIEVNGRAAAEFNLPQWRRRFGYVSQDPTLFNGSLRMNLQLAKPDAAQADIEEACRLAGADEFISVLPEGYDTVVGDRGYSLSGGQRKRVAIARALISRPDVLILDEATTSFEQSLEQEILRSIRAARPDLTVIQVTHRLHGTAEADWVIALQDGRVRFSGPWAARLAVEFEQPEVLSSA